MSKNVGKIRLRGIAESNGVACEAGLFYGLAGINRIGKMVTVKDDGTFSCEDYDFEKNTPKISEKIKKRGKILKVISIILIVVCLCGYFASAFTAPEVNYLGFGMAYIFFGLSIMSEGVAIGLGRFLGDSEMEEFSKYAGAKNSVLNSYCERGKIPTVEEAQSTTRIAREADYVEKANFASFMMLMGVCRLLPNTWFFIASVLVLIICLRFDSKAFKGVWQIAVTTSKPEEIHYQTAIKALEEALKWTEKIKISVSRKEVSIEELKRYGHVFDEEKCKDCSTYEDCKKMWSKIMDSSQKIYQDVVEIVDESDDDESQSQ